MICAFPAGPPVPEGPLGEERIRSHLCSPLREIGTQPDFALHLSTKQIHARFHVPNATDLQTCPSARGYFNVFLNATCGVVVHVARNRDTCI
jgi:hypothetical protein